MSSIPEAFLAQIGIELGRYLASEPVETKAPAKPPRVTTEAPMVLHTDFGSIYLIDCGTHIEGQDIHNKDVYRLPIDAEELAFFVEVLAERRAMTSEEFSAQFEAEYRRHTGCRAHLRKWIKVMLGMPEQPTRSQRFDDIQRRINDVLQDAYLARGEA